jgi:manganese/zinc/iron transport system ATP- binding protein
VDAVTERTILGVLHGLARQGKTVLMVHHDLSLIAEHFDHVLLLAAASSPPAPCARLSRKKR